MNDVVSMQLTPPMLAAVLLQSTEITFLNDDVTRRDWSDADCWFANSTCFDETVGCGVAAVPSQLLTTLIVD